MVDFLLPRWALVVLWASASSADDAFRDVPATDAFRDAMALWQRGVHEAVARVEAKKLQKVLAALLGTDIKVHNALLCIIPHTSVVLKFFLPDQNTGSSCLIFYLPACLL